jgi:pimeloyl-ACP methyl ester carboxylesterase
MNATTETRELITLDGSHATARGTYHKVFEKCSNSQSKLAETDRIGVYFLSSLSPTRAGTGDSTVYWADSFSKLGYPCFRMDLPGFGDSDGDPPPELLSFINKGGYAAIASAQAKEIVRRFSLSGVVIVGLCAGAVSALHTAACCKECRGVVLLDPYFHLPLAPRSKVWEKLTGRLSRSAFGRFISDIYERSYKRLKAVRAFFFGVSPPSNANFSLFECWKELASAGMPILVFKAPGAKLRGGEFDYLQYVLGLASRKNKVVVKVIEGAGHTFSNLVGRLAVRRHTESWLNECFPLQASEQVGVSLTERETAPATTSDSKLNSESSDKLHEGCLRP